MISLRPSMGPLIIIDEGRFRLSNLNPHFILVARMSGVYFREMDSIRADNTTAEVSIEFVRVLLAVVVVVVVRFQTVILTECVSLSRVCFIFVLPVTKGADRVYRPICAQSEVISSHVDLPCGLSITGDRAVAVSWLIVAFHSILSDLTIKRRGSPIWTDSTTPC